MPSWGAEPAAHLPPPSLLPYASFISNSVEPTLRPGPGAAPAREEGHNTSPHCWKEPLVAGSDFPSSPSLLWPRSSTDPWLREGNGLAQGHTANKRTQDLVLDKDSTPPRHKVKRSA